MLARTVRPDSRPQDLHVDFARDAAGFPMVGFILMVDEFRRDNGATRFIPGSHQWAGAQGNLVNDRVSDYDGQCVAYGPAGSVILYNGAVWHGHTANSSSQPRRSIQGAYIRRNARSAVNPTLPSRMTPATLARISPLAKYLVAV
jgi:ectoine hydroxylase-related dioxygenase (phytanoyl-CoA dioxygenase family)